MFFLGQCFFLLKKTCFLFKKKRTVFLLCISSWETLSTLHLQHLTLSVMTQRCLSISVIKGKSYCSLFLFLLPNHGGFSPYLFLSLWNYHCCEAVSRDYDYSNLMLYKGLNICFLLGFCFAIILIFSYIYGRWWRRHFYINIRECVINSGDNLSLRLHK